MAAHRRSVSAGAPGTPTHRRTGSGGKSGGEKTGEPPPGVPPFLCCVRIDRLQVRGARRADGATLPRPLRLSVHAPLTLENTLPIRVEWAILVPKDELQVYTHADGPGGRVHHSKGGWPSERVSAGSRGGAAVHANDDLEDHSGFSGRRHQVNAAMGYVRSVTHRSFPMRTRKRRHRDSIEFEMDDADLIGQTTRAARAFSKRHLRHLNKRKPTLRRGESTSVATVCSGELAASGLVQVHSVSPRQQWQLTLRVDGYVERLSAIALGLNSLFLYVSKIL